MPTISVSKTSKIVIGVLAAVAVGAVLIGPKPDKTTPASAETIAASGATTIEVLDPLHDRPFQVSTWEPSGDTNNTLVVISHGFEGDRTSHDGLAASLAADGYTIAAPTHPDRAGLLADDDLLDPLALRPRHLSLTIDAMSGLEPFDEVIVIGHSLGGYSALRLAGANPSGASLAQHCVEVPNDEVLCTPQMQRRVDRLTTDNADFTDDRVDRIVLLAPGYGPLFSSDDLATVHGASLIIEADADSQLPGGQVATLVEAMPGDAESVTVDGGHYVFLRTCTPVEVADLPELCVDEDADREQVHAEVLSTIVNFIEG